MELTIGLSSLPTYPLYAHLAYKRHVYYLSDQTMRNMFSIQNFLAGKGVKYDFVKPGKACHAISNGISIHNFEVFTIRFHKCGRKNKTEGRVSHLL